MQYFTTYILYTTIGELRVVASGGQCRQKMFFVAFLSLYIFLLPHWCLFYLYPYPLSLSLSSSLLHLSLSLSPTYHWWRVVHTGFKMSNSVCRRGPDWILLVCDNRRYSCLSGCGWNLLHGIIITRGRGIGEGRHSRVWRDLTHAVRCERSLRCKRRDHRLQVRRVCMGEQK